MLTQHLKDSINQFIDRFKTTTIFDNQTTLEQISILLLIRKIEFNYEDLPDKYRWDKYKDYLQSYELVNYINSAVLPFINDTILNSGTDNNSLRKLKLHDYFLDNYNFLIDSMEYVNNLYSENIFDNEPLSNLSIQSEGELYEYILVQTLGKDMYARFDIQKHLAQFIVELIDPNIGKTTADLACGTGGFLVSVYQHIVTKHSTDKNKDENSLSFGTNGVLLDEKEKTHLKENSLIGFDYDDSRLLFSKMNLLMHGLTPKVIKLDTLGSQYDEYQQKKEFDYILANPPFGIRIREDHSLTYEYGTRSAELLFLVRIMNSLKEGGKSAVILPEGVLSNVTKDCVQIRRLLMTKCKLEGVISFPIGLFQPFTAVKTSLLIFANEDGGNRQEPVWFFDMKSDGYSLDSKRQKLRENPLPEVIKLWKNRNQILDDDRSSNNFWVPYEEIANNKYQLNIDLYSKTEENIAYEDPDILLNELFSLEIEINQNLENLRKVKMQ